MSWNFDLCMREYNKTGIYNIEAPSCNIYCSGKSISITYCEFVFVALCIQHAMRLCLIVIYGLLVSTVLFHLIW